MRGKIEENCESKLNAMETYITTTCLLVLFSGIELLNLKAAFLMGGKCLRYQHGNIDLVVLEI